MKKSKIAAISLVTLLALGGLATGLAFTIKNVTQKDETSIEGDYLELNFNDRSGTFKDITDLTSDHSVKKYVNINIDKHGKLEGNYFIDYTFTVTTPVTVSVYDTEPSLDGSTTPLSILNKDNTKYSNQIVLDGTNYQNILVFEINDEFFGNLDGTLHVALRKA